MNQAATNKASVFIAITGTVIALASLAISYDTRQFARAQLEMQLNDFLPKAELYSLLAGEGNDRRLVLSVSNRGGTCTIADAGFDLPVEMVRTSNGADAFQYIHIKDVDDELPYRLDKHDVWIITVPHKAWRSLSAKDKERIRGFGIATTSGMLSVDADLWQAFIEVDD